MADSLTPVRKPYGGGVDDAYVVAPLARYAHCTMPSAPPSGDMAVLSWVMLGLRVAVFVGHFELDDSAVVLTDARAITVHTARQFCGFVQANAQESELKAAT